MPLLRFSWTTQSLLWVFAENSSEFRVYRRNALTEQIEHHLFPTMPRCNLNTCMRLVKEFCRENNLPYLVNDYFEGYALNLKQLENIARLSRAKAA
ncbi:hypothetical protein TELCIR_04090 [Teladorsagia circumcincta]|uniref:Uncharacterized protein n=1 Tax=Teladorsagia circumcincta TaxID=45464 RepID=A0A2G9UUS7_TELCI|nr:hypothetical protein TELCIR_04090 [Teladorsagia circumcincta]